MVNSLYQLTRKGWLQALSFIFALGIFIAVLMKATTFAGDFGGQIPYLAVLVFYGMAILWIHCIGFEIRSTIWKLIFLPLLGYLIIVPSLIYIVLN